MMLLYSFALTAVALLSAPVWGWRMLRQGRYRVGLRERLGAVPARVLTFAQGRRVVWVHAVSIGETLAAVRLVAALEAALPGYAVVFSTTTPTGQSLARERLGADRVFFYPLDFAFAVQAYLRSLRPELLVLMESELWPRMLHECAQAGVPVVVVNARVSDRSLRRSLRLRMLWKLLLAKVSLLLTQSAEDARRWIAIGAPEDRVHDTGNLKYDVCAASETPLTALLRKHLPAQARVLVCGSTHDGEESLLLDCWKDKRNADAVMILAPRHPERTMAVAQLAAERGVGLYRLSQWRMTPQSIGEGAVLLVDTVGELTSLYSLARVAFVGGSLVPHGGQNPLEPVQFGVPVVMGESYENFRDVVRSLREADALTVVAPHGLCEALATRMQEPATPEAQSRARAVFTQHSGATVRCVEALTALLQERER